MPHQHSSTKLTEVIFHGKYSGSALRCLEALQLQSEKVYFNIPEDLTVVDSEIIMSVLEKETYADLAISTSHWKVFANIISNVYFNCIKNGEELELLFFFDLNDLDIAPETGRVEVLKQWCSEFSKEYHLGQYICRMDAAGDEDYYFDEKGYGPLFYQLFRD